MTIQTTDSNPLVANRGTGATVELDAIDKSYGSQPVLTGFSLSLAPGEFVSLLGPSGCGKTTVLRVLAGLEVAQGGSVRIDGVDVTRVPVNRRDIGMVFQSYSLFPHLSALANTTFGLATRHVKGKEAKERAEAALALVGLAEYRDRYPHELSGGQQQRVALARALVTEPNVLLLDEPLSALDAKVRVQLRDEIRRIQLRLGITTVFVTHDQEEALAISDRVAVMSHGHIEQIGAPEALYQQPATPAVASFVGVSSLVPAVVTAGRARVFRFDLPLVTPHADGPALAYIRPESVSIAADGAGVEATVLESTFLGSMRRTRLRTIDGEVELRMQHDVSQRLEYGDRVQVALAEVPVALADVVADGARHKMEP